MHALSLGLRRVSSELVMILRTLCCPNDQRLWMEEEAREVLTGQRVLLEDYIPSSLAGSRWDGWKQFWGFNQRAGQLGLSGRMTG